MQPLRFWANASSEKRVAPASRALQDNGFDRGPKRGRGSWHEFIQRHIKTVWASDFFPKTVWTLRGPVTYCVLFFIHLHTRRVHIAGMTPNKGIRGLALIFWPPVPFRLSR